MTKPVQLILETDLLFPPNPLSTGKINAALGTAAGPKLSTGQLSGLLSGLLDAITICVFFADTLK